METIQEIELKNKERFLLGSIMPDAYKELKYRDKTHFANRTDGTYFDFNLFREKFDRQMNEDNLYLGYYMHLVEDVFYRQFIHRDEFRVPKSQEEVLMLHNDYHILNSYIVGKYNCQNILQDKINLDSEKIMEIAEFRIEGFLKDLTGALDFNIKPVCVYSVKGKTRVNDNATKESFGMLYVAEIFSFEEIHSEIEKIVLSDDLVQEWTYPIIQPKLIEEAKKRNYL